MRGINANAQILSPDLWEVIFVDHGSTDGTLALLEDCAERLRSRGVPVRISTHRENHIALSRQWILEQAETPWIAFVDSDVVLPRWWLERTLQQALIADAACAGLAGGLRTRPLASSLAGVAKMTRSAAGHAFTEQMRDQESVGRRARHLPTAAAVFRRSALLSVGGFDARYRDCGEDLELGERLTANGFYLRKLPAHRATHVLSCRSPADWLRRAFRFGRTRTLVAKRHPRLFLQPQTLIPIFLILLEISLLIDWRWLVAFCALHWLTLLIAFAPREGRNAFRLAHLTWSTHQAYAWGECMGLLAPAVRR